MLKCRESSFFMGYYYQVYLALNQDPATISPDLKQKIINAYKTPKDENSWPPILGRDCYGGGYQYGPDDIFCEIMKHFTSQFPDITFIIYYSFLDHSEIKVIKFKDTEHEIVHTAQALSFTSNDGNIGYRSSISDFYVENDISEWLHDYGK